MRTLSRHGVRLLAVVALMLSVVAFAPSSAQAATPSLGQMTFQRFLSCQVPGGYTATAWVTFEMRPTESLAFHWSKIQYMTTPRFKADYVSFSYGKQVKIRFGQPNKKAREVPHVVSYTPKSTTTSALPAHLTMKVLSQNGSCIAKFL